VYLSRSGPIGSSTTIQQRECWPTVPGELGLTFFSASFLTNKERDEVERRLHADHGHLSNDFNIKYVWQAIKDWKIYIHCLILMAGFCSIYSFALFLPTIIKNMGYTANSAQLMSVPPYVCACFFTIAASYIADRIGSRAVFMVGFQVVGIVGFAMLAGSGQSRIQYAGTVLAAIGKFGQLDGEQNLTLARNLSSNPARASVEQLEHRRQPEARHRYCNAGNGGQLRGHHRKLRIPVPRWAKVHKRP
jgi:hypothetical protein